MVWEQLTLFPINQNIPKDICILTIEMFYHSDSGDNMKKLSDEELIIGRQYRFLFRSGEIGSNIYTFIGFNSFNNICMSKYNIITEFYRTGNVQWTDCKAFKFGR